MPLTSAAPFHAETAIKKAGGLIYQMHNRDPMKVMVSGGVYQQMYVKLL